MTTDKLANALIALMTAVKPHADITVADARAFDELDIPAIVVDVREPEKHSLALPGVMKCPVEITLRVHPGDDTNRSTAQSWADTIERNLNGIGAVRDYITTAGLGIQCDYFQMDGGSTRWEETTFEATFTCVAWVQRTT